MDSKVRVSVVTGVLNGEKFLAEAIESVLAQTFTGWELLLVDDGSTDASATIARGYAARYPNAIRCLAHDGHRRRGQGATRNLGIENASGEFIAILDHDDVWLPQKLKQQVEILDSHPDAAMVYGATLYWHNWKGDGTSAEPDRLQLPGVPVNQIYRPPRLLKLILSDQIVPPIPTDFMFRKEIGRRLGGFEEAFIGAMSMFEDQAFLVKLYAAFPVFVSGECWDRYRIHPDQHCARILRSGTKGDTEHFFLSWALQYLTFQDVLDEELEGIFRRRMWPHRHPLLAKVKRFGQRLGSKAQKG